MTAADAPHVEVRSLGALREWLRAYHASARAVWLVTFKKAHPDHLPFGEVVEELLCWGWIDSTVRSVDEHRMKHLVGPRKETSAWSAVNKKTVERMRAAGRMQPAGEARIAAAMANGMWTFLDDVERLEVPGDLGAALGDGRAAWEGWSRSIRRAWLETIKRAKTAPTREKRIADCAAAARAGLKTGGLR